MTTQFERLMRAAGAVAARSDVPTPGQPPREGEFEIVEFLMVSILFRPSHRWEIYTEPLRGPLNSNGNCRDVLMKKAPPLRGGACRSSN